MENTGKRFFGWSGWCALFDDTDFGLKFNYYPKVEFDGIDGPYLIKNTLHQITSKNEVITANISPHDTILVRVNNNDKDKFHLQKKQIHTIGDDQYDMPSRLIAISDIEGNFNGFSSFLKKNGVIDSMHNWSYGDGHLVLVGDMVDRGDDVVQVLWLIYKLESQAKEKGGKVHFVIGNHEVLNFHGNGGYNQEKYIKAAQAISGKEEWELAIQYMYSDSTEIGQWLRKKNVIEKVGDYIFVHGGLSPELLEHDIPLSKINNIIRKNWDSELSNTAKKDNIAAFLLGRKGPLWYRGLVSGYKYYDKIEESELDKILKYYRAKKVVVGHTVVKDISTDFSGKVIRIDLKHGKEKNSGLTKGLLIENGVEYIVDDTGQRKALD